LWGSCLPGVPVSGSKVRHALVGDPMRKPAIVITL
jgi:hypothetical protein